VRDTACTAIVLTILALLAGDPGIAHKSTSCFSSGQTFSSYQEDSSFILSTYTFPVLLVAKLYDNTSDFIYSLVSRNSTFYNYVIFANYMIAPTIKSVQTNDVLGDSYIFLVSMNRVQVSVFFSYKMFKQQYNLHAELAQIDYGTELAYNSIIPILWACGVTEKLMNPAISAVFVVDGIVDNTKETIILHVLKKSKAPLFQRTRYMQSQKVLIYIIQKHW